MDVLIVDNEPAFAELLAARLELQGYSARSAGSGEEALKKLKERPCDVALLGVHLVGMSGLELLSRMRRKWPQTPCIMLTEPAQAEQGAEAMRFGAYDCWPSRFPWRLWNRRWKERSEGRRPNASTNCTLRQRACAPWTG